GRHRRRQEDREGAARPPRADVRRGAAHRRRQGHAGRAVPVAVREHADERAHLVLDRDRRGARARQARLAQPQQAGGVDVGAARRGAQRRGLHALPGAHVDHARRHERRPPRPLGRRPAQAARRGRAGPEARAQAAQGVQGDGRRRRRHLLPRGPGRMGGALPVRRQARAGRRRAAQARQGPGGARRAHRPQGLPPTGRRPRAHGARGRLRRGARRREGL
ncbi:MAG: conservedhypothetical protein, partial [uncultured Gemmatimonadaceae bacterium]